MPVCFVGIDAPASAFPPGVWWKIFKDDRLRARGLLADVDHAVADGGVPAKGNRDGAREALGIA